MLNIPGVWQGDSTATSYLIENDSPNDLYLRFGPIDPVAFNAPGTPASYEIRLRAWKDAILPVARTSQEYDGKLYYLVQAPSGALATSGTISSRNNIGVTSFGHGEAPSEVVAVTRQVDLSSQPRVIALPFGSLSRARDRLTVSATGLLQSYALAGFAGVALNPSAPASPGSFHFATYLHFLHMSSDTQSYFVTWNVRSTDTSGGNQFSGHIFQGHVAPGQSIDLSFFVTPEIDFPIVMNTAQVFADLNIDVMSAAGGQLVYTTGWTVDPTSGYPVPVIGGGTPQGIQGGGAIF